MADQNRPFPHRDQIGDDITDSLFFFDRMGIASATEMTGLIPAPPENASERIAYEEMRDLPLPGAVSEIKTKDRHIPS